MPIHRKNSVLTFGGQVIGTTEMTRSMSRTKVLADALKKQAAKKPGVVIENVDPESVPQENSEETIVATPEEDYAEADRAYDRGKDDYHCGMDSIYSRQYKRNRGIE